jgi:parallel beta-helix repeat protein
MSVQGVRIHGIHNALLVSLYGLKGKVMFARFLRMILIPGSILLGMVITVPANATDRYVDITNPSAVDSGTGTVTPWKTLHYAVANSGAGDVIHLAPGVYSKANGESDLVGNQPVTPVATNVTIQGPAGGGAILDGTGATNWTSGVSSSKMFTGLAVVNLEIRNFSSAGLYMLDADSGIMISGCKIYQNPYGIKVETGVGGNSSPQIMQNIIYNNTLAGIAVFETYGGASSPNITNNLLFGNQDGIILDNSGGGTVSPVIFHNTINGPGTASGAAIATTGVVAVGPFDFKYNSVSKFAYGISLYSGSSVASDYNNFHTVTTLYVNATAGAYDQSGDPKYDASYKPLAGSALIDKIPSAANAVNVDKDGTARPQPTGGLKDIGCFEYMPPTGSLSFTMAFSPGVRVQDFVIRSIPLYLSPGTPSAVFGPYIGTYDTMLMRLGHWDADTQAYIEYPGDDDPDPMDPGDGIWFLFRNGMTITLNGTYPSTEVQPLTGFAGHAVYVKDGWNQIGNPFPHAVSVADIVVTSPAEMFSAAYLTQGIFWVWDNGNYYAATTLAAGQGGWVYKYGGGGYLYFRDATPAADVQADGSLGHGVIQVSDSYARPPSPPGAFSDWSSSGGGGGGGGCFIHATAD